MLKAILAFVLTRRPVVLLAVFAFLVAGVSAFSKLNIEAYPNPAPVILEIAAQASGLSAEEMERYYTRPMEIGLATTPGVDIVRSTSSYGLSFVRVTFKYGVDYYFAYTQAALSLQQNVSLPNGVSPQIQASSLVGEIFRYQLVGPAHFGLTSLRTTQDWVVQRRLLTVPGVVQVVTWGGTTKQYEVEADLTRLQGFGITLPQLIAAVGNANTNVGGRTINVGQQSVNIRGVGLIRDTTDIGNVVLSQTNGAPVRVKDVATVKVGYLPRLGKAGRDDQDDVVTAIVVMNRTLRTNEVLARLKAEVERINHDGTLPPGVKIVPFYDRERLVNVTSHTVLHNLVLGCVLVFLIQWIFLGDLASALIVSANIPFALFFSVILLVLMGDSANLLSLGAIDFGIIVDSAVILVENLIHNLQRPREERLSLLGEFAQRWHDPQLPAESRRIWTNRLRMIFMSSVQVDRAVLFSSAITVAAFIPLFTMQGVEGQIFNPMARTYAYALTGALLATFTVTPVLSSLLLPRRMKMSETFIVASIRRVYSPLLRWALEHRLATVGGGVAFLAAAALLLPRIGTEFLPTLEEGNLWIRATMPPTISLEAGMDKVDRMRAILKAQPEVITVVSQHGRPDDGSDAAGFYNAELFVPLKPFEEWPRGYSKDELVDELQKQFRAEFPGVEFNFSQYIQDNIEEGLSGVKGANSVKIIGPDLQTLEKLADQVLHEMSQVKGVEDLGVFRVLGQPNLNVTVDRAKAARYGLNTGDVNTVVQAAAGGTLATTVLEGDRQFGLTVRLKPQYRSSLEAVGNIMVGYATPGGNAYIPLRELATITLDTGASYIFHESNERYVPVKFSVRGRDLGSTVAEAEERIRAHVQLPQGYRINWAGEFEELQQAQRRLEIVAPIAIGAILLLLYMLFNSLRDSLLTLAGIPFSAAGGLIALYVSGLNLSISAAIGFVSLFGVSVMNGILILTYFNHLVAEGKEPGEAMRHAAEQQMRPMLMMALSACIGLLPAAVATGIGSQVQRPLATVVVGGMLLGPIMLLVVAPALQVAVLKWSVRRQKTASPSSEIDDEP